MFTEEQKAWMLEAERRGVLSPGQKAYLGEARKRGLIETPAPEGGVSDSRGFMDEIGGAARRFQDGVFFGAADELHGAVTAIPRAAYDAFQGKGFDIGRGYEQGRDDWRQKAKAFDAANPKTSTALEIGGAVAGPGKFLAPARGASVPMAMAQSSALGGLGGSAYGFASTDGDIADRVEGAMVPAAVGALGGPVITGAVAGAGALWNRVAEALTKRGVDKTAAGKIVKSLARDGKTPDQALREVQAMGPEATLADTGKNARATMEVIASRPGQGAAEVERKLMDRAGGQFSRIMDTFDGSVKQSTDVFDAKALDKLWEAAKSKRIPLSPRLMGLMDRPSLEKAFKYAKDLAEEGGEDMSKFPTFEQFRSQNIDGAQIIEAETRVFHWMKKALDDIIEPKRDAVSGLVAPEFGRNKMEALKRTRAAFRDTIKAQNPLYAKALKQSEALAKTESAFERGGEIFRRRNEREVAAQMKGMGDAERRAFQRGVIQAIDDRLNSLSQVDYDVTPALLKMRRKLNVVFGNNAKKIMQQIETERGFSLTKNSVLKGSPTAPRQQAIADFDGEGMPILGAAIDAMTGNGISMANMGGRAIRSGMDYIRRPSERVGDRVAELMLNPEANRAEIVGLLNAARRGMDVSNSAQGRVLGGLLGYTPK